MVLVLALVLVLVLVNVLVLVLVLAYKMLNRKNCGKFPGRKFPAYPTLSYPIPALSLPYP